MSSEQEPLLHFLYLCLCLYLYHVPLVVVMQPPGVQDQQEDWDTVDALELVLEQMQEPVEAQVVKQLLGGPDLLEDWGTALVLVLVQTPEPVEVQDQVQQMLVFLDTNQIKRHIAVPNEEANCCKWEPVEAQQWVA